jgi:hypothetical protein
LPARPPRAKTKRAESGFCIRCATEIRLSAAKPLCAADYKKWAEFKNRDYPEKFCLKCGKPNRTSVEQPFCKTCQ